jgi:hypothetical protein
LTFANNPFYRFAKPFGCPVIKNTKAFHMSAFLARAAPTQTWARHEPSFFQFDLMVPA